MKLGSLKRVPLREVWKNEARDFSKWLATKDGMELLSEAVGFDIEPVETESAVDNFSLDILGRVAGTEQTVVIENQIEDSNHDHLGKLVTYAAGKDASCAIWIVRKAKDAHRKAIEFLNNTSKGTIGYFLLEIEAWKIGDSEPAPKFNIVEMPNDWARTESDTTLTPTNKLCQRYWEEFIKYASGRQDFLKVFKLRKPFPQNWYDFAIGRSGMNMSASVSDYHKRIRVSIYVSRKHEENAVLLENVPQLSKAMGMEITVGQGIDKTLNISRKFDIREEAKWSEAFAWYCDMLPKYRTAIYSVLEEQ